MSEPWYTIHLRYYAEPSGTLGVAECGREIPFKVERVFWVYGVEGAEAIRGDHAHAALRQVLICAKGALQLDLEARDGRRESFALREGGAGLYLDGPVWRTMRGFTSDAALVVLCDREYAHDRVIRSRDEFLAL